MSKAIRNFIIGMGSVLDLRPVDDVQAEIARRRRRGSDFEAMQHDWEMVGRDMRKAIDRFERDRPQHCG